MWAQASAPFRDGGTSEDIALLVLVSKVGLLRWVAAGNGSVAEFKFVFGFGHFERRTRIQRKPQQVRDYHQMHDTAEINALRDEVECLARRDCSKIYPLMTNCIYASLLIKR